MRYGINVQKSSFVRSLVLLGILFFCKSISAPAAPAYMEWTYMQTVDGSWVEATLVGDESWHCYVTRDGLQMGLDSDGKLELLSKEQIAQGEQQRRRKCNSASVRRSPSATLKGERRQLVILAAYSDCDFADSNPLVLWNKIFNTENLSEGRFRGSVHDYFRDQSYGQFLLSFDLKMAHLSKPSAYYGGTDRNGNDEKVGQLVVDALKEVEASVSDWSPYDWDGDGMVDQVFVLFAGKGQNNGGSVSTVWPQQWLLSEEGTGAYRVSSGGRTYVVDNYGCFAELDRSGSYGTFGTLCHEYGHCLGLPDFYYGSTSVVKSWDVMDYGLYNEGGYCPAGYSAHERWCLGWMDLKELSKPATVADMEALSSKDEAYLVRNDGYYDEYFVIENRQPEGWDAFLPGSGVLIFHVDYDEEVWRTGVPNSYYQKRYSLVAANNRSSATYEDGWCYPYGSGATQNNSLTAYSKPASTLLHPNSDGGYVLEKPVTDITVSNGLAGFLFCGGAPSGIDLLQGGGNVVRRYYDVQGRYRGSDFMRLPSGVYIDRASAERKTVVKR